MSVGKKLKWGNLYKREIIQGTEEKYFKMITNSIRVII